MTFWSQTIYASEYASSFCINLLCFLFGYYQFQLLRTVSMSWNFHHGFVFQFPLFFLSCVDNIWQWSMVQQPLIRQICVTVAINHSHMDISVANINKTIKWLNYYVNLQRRYVSWGQMFLKKYIKTQIYWTLGHGSTLLNVSSLRKKAIAY